MSRSEIVNAIREAQKIKCSECRRKAIGEIKARAESERAA